MAITLSCEKCYGILYIKRRRQRSRPCKSHQEEGRPWLRLFKKKKQACPGQEGKACNRILCRAAGRVAGMPRPPSLLHPAPTTHPSRFSPPSPPPSTDSDSRKPFFLFLLRKCMALAKAWEGKGVAWKWQGSHFQHASFHTIQAW